MGLSINGVWAGENENKRQAKRVNNDDDDDLPSHLQSWMQVHADQEYILQIDANRLQIEKRVSSIFCHVYL